MDIPVDARVECKDGPCGQSTALIVNPVTRKVTHIVVRGRYSQEYLVPVTQVEDTSRGLIRLYCITDELSRMELFVETHYVQDDQPDPATLGYGTMLNAPFAAPMDDYDMGATVERIPPGELAVRRGTHVEATDGRVGIVGELVVDKEGEHVTHLVLQEGHLWGRKEVTLPLSAIDRVEGNRVYLNLDKKAVNRLPTVPLKRR